MLKTVTNVNQLVIALFLFTLFIAGCAGNYKVDVNSYLDKDTSIGRTKSIFVLVDTKVPNPLLAKEVGAKIENYLRADGYTLAKEFSQSDYVLSFAFNIDSGVTKSYSGSYSSTKYKLNVHTGKYELVPQTYSYSGSKTRYTRFLALVLMDTQALLKSGEATPVWVAEVTSRGKKSDLRSVLDYLLVAAFDYYPEDSKGMQRVTLSGSDARVQKLY